MLRDEKNASLKKGLDFVLGRYVSPEDCNSCRHSGPHDQQLKVAVGTEGTNHVCSLAELYGRFLGQRLAPDPTRKLSQRGYCVQVVLIIFSVSTRKSAVSRLPALFSLRVSSPGSSFPSGRT